MYRRARIEYSAWMNTVSSARFQDTEKGQQGVRPQAKQTRRVEYVEVEVAKENADGRLLGSVGGDIEVHSRDIV